MMTWRSMTRLWPNRPLSPGNTLPVIVSDR
jgi:hypothetical protein